MEFIELKEELNEEISAIHSSDFELEISESTMVPNHSDSQLTYSNFDSKIKKVKRVKTSILFIDIRKSTEISLKNSPETMAKLYSSFTRSMIRVAEFHGGKVRNIIGDRVMVVFDWAKCGEQSVNTAISMNEIITELINKKFTEARVSCGIGIDSGEVLVTKCGVIKRGVENAHYKNLTWSGKVANVASKLTDVAGKYVSNSKTIDGAQVGFIYPWNNGDWTWQFLQTEKLVEELRKGVTFSPMIKYPSDYFQSLFYTTKTEYDSYTFPKILITENVLKELRTENNDHLILKIGKLREIKRSIEGINLKVYGLQ